MDTVSLIKYTVLLVGIPIWLPFVRELWFEFNLAMREDGGLWGQAPTPRERQRITDQIAREPLRQIDRVVLAGDARHLADDGLGE